MAQEVINYEAVLADLEAKRTALDAAIAALRQVLSLGTDVNFSGTANASRPVDAATIPDDAFFGLSIVEAAKKYLSIVKRKQSVKEIADALDRGGLAHTSSDFVNTVRTMMNRQAVNDPELVRVGPGDWGLSAWYGNRRPKQEPKKVKRAPRSSPKRQTTSKADDVVRQPTLMEYAADVIRNNGGPMTVEAILAGVEARAHRKVGRATLVGMLAEKVRKGEVFTRPAESTYGLAESSNVH